MKKLLSITLLIIIAAITYYSVNDIQPVVTKPVFLEQKKEDNIKARLLREHQMLKDPVTGKIPENIYNLERVFSKNLPVKENQLDKGNGVTAANWRFRGPGNQGGRTRALAIDVSNESIMLAGGVSGGMFRTNNSGASWNRVTSLQNLQSVTCVAQDTKSGSTNTWYYGTGELVGNSAGGTGSPYQGDGIFKSNDNGLTWNLLPSTSSGTPQTFSSGFNYIWNIAVSPAGNEIYAATYGGITRSTNGGTTWGYVLGNPQTGAEYSDVAVTSNGIVYATVSKNSSNTWGIYRSTNEGDSWTDITPTNLNNSTFNRIALDISKSNNSIVYFLAHTPGSGTLDHMLYKYNNSNSSFTDLSDNIPALGGQENVGNFDSQGSYDLIVKVKPDNSNFVIIGGTNLYRSTNGFSTPITNSNWIGGYKNDGSGYAPYPNHHSDQHSFAWLPSNPNVVFSGNDGGVCKSNNISAGDVVWEFLSNGYHTTQFYAISIDANSTGSYRNDILGGLQDNGTHYTKLTDEAANWEEIFGGDGSYNAISSQTSSLLVSYQNGNSFRLKMSNGVITSYTNITPANASGFSFINPFFLDPNDEDVLYMPAGTTLWRNSDLSGIPVNNQDPTSVNWSDYSNTTQSGITITTVGTSKSSANLIYYGNDNGEVFKITNAANMNSNPVNITGSNFPASANVQSIAVNPNNGNEVFVCFSNYSVLSLFYSADGGNNWSSVGGNLEQNSNGSGNGPSCRSVNILPLPSTTVYLVGTSTGLYTTENFNGMSTVWTREADSKIGNSVVSMVLSRPSDGLVVASTHGIGVYSANYLPTGINDGDLSVKSFELGQNYPNPFNPSTTINYTVANEGNVSIDLYDVTGRKVQSLVNEHKPEGKYSVNFTAGKLSSGVYYYTLSAGSIKQTKKMVLLK